jgi:hypothetical protein
LTFDNFVILSEMTVGYHKRLVILNVTEGGVKDLLHLPFNIGA